MKRHAARCFSSQRPNVFEDDQSSKRTVVGESPWKLGNRDHSLIETREKSNRKDLELYQKAGLELNTNGLKDGLAMTFEALH